MSRFDYIKYDEQTQKIQSLIKGKFQEAENLGIVYLKDSRWRSLFLTHLEIAYMAAGKALRDEQIERNQGSELQEERGIHET